MAVACKGVLAEGLSSRHGFRQALNHMNPKTVLEGQSMNWYAIQVRSRWEQSTASVLNGKGYETLLPTYEAEKRWGRRVKLAKAPLFPGYVFCKFDVTSRLPILTTPGVICVVARGRVPIPVDNVEMNAIETLVRTGVPAEPWPYLEVGQRVRIEDHSLRGIEGILISFKGRQRVIVSVSLLQRSVALEIERSRVMPVGSFPVPAPCGSLAF